MSTQPAVVNGSTKPAPNPSAMKEPYTQRSGQSIDLSSVVYPLSYGDKSGIESLREEFAKRGTPMSREDVLSTIIDRGITAIRNSQKWGEVNRETRKVEVSAKAEVADLLSSGPLTQEKKAEALDILLEAQEKAAAIKAAARKRR
jgi:hypothetical protein